MRRQIAKDKIYCNANEREYGEQIQVLNTWKQPAKWAISRPEKIFAFLAFLALTVIYETDYIYRALKMYTISFLNRLLCAVDVYLFNAAAALPMAALDRLPASAPATEQKMCFTKTSGGTPWVIENCAGWRWHSC